MQVSEINEQNINGIYRVASTGKVIQIKDAVRGERTTLLRIGEYSSDTLILDNDEFLDAIA